VRLASTTCDYWDRPVRERELDARLVVADRRFGETNMGGYLASPPPLIAQRRSACFVHAAEIDPPVRDSARR
jgi:hypothetical protein